MALSDVIVAFNVHDWFGGDFDVRRAKAWATNNADDQKVDDKSTNESRIGSGTGTVAADGTGTFTHWAPGAVGNPTSWQTSYHFDVPDRNAPGGRARKTFGPFTVTGTSKTVTNKALTSNVATLTTSTAHGLVVGNTITVAISDAVFDGTHVVTAVPSTTTISYAKTNANVTSAAATGTLTSPNVLLTSLEQEQAVPATYLSTTTALLDSKVAAAEAARDAAVDISGISTSDGVVEALVKNTGGAGPLTSAALSATIAAEALPRNVEASVTPIGKADGTLTAFDTGQAIHNWGNHPLTMLNDEIVHTVSQAQNAGYIENDVAFSAPVAFMRAEVQFPAVVEASACAVAFVVPSTKWTTGALSNAGIHLVLFANGIWHISRWESGVGESTWYATSDVDGAHPEAAVLGRFADCRDGEWREVSIWIDHAADTCTINFPDGSAATVDGAGFITADCGNFAIFELYETAGTETPAKFRDLAAGTYAPDENAAFVPRSELSTILGGLKSERRQFTASGSGSFPPGTLGAFVTLHGGGGGGGSGRRGAAGSVRCGGGGGGSGGVINGQWFPASALGGAFNVVIGTGGAGGAAVTVNDTNGSAGSAGVLTSFTSSPAYLRALGGGGGGGGTNATGASGGAGAPLSTAGSAASVTGGAGSAGGTVYTGAPGGAGSGGGVTSADVAGAGGAGGAAGIFTSGSVGGAGGVVDGAAPGTGAAANPARPADGAGGGAASITTAAQAGANPTGYGGGGGGGGASLNGNNSGKGGDGQAGYAEVLIVKL